MLDYGVTASKISNARREKGFTQEELSVRLGVSAQAVSKWERGMSLPDIELLLDLAGILGVTVDYLLDKNADNAADNIKDNVKKESDTGSTLDKSQFTDPISVNIGVGLIPLITKDFLGKIIPLRRNMWYETGVPVPIIRFKDDIKLQENSCVINVYDKIAWEGLYSEIDSAVQTDILYNLTDVIKNNLYEFVDRQMVKQLVEHVRSSAPFIIEGVIPEKISLTKLKIILRELVKQRTSIRSLVKIIDILDEAAENTSNTNEMLAVLLRRI